MLNIRPIPVILDSHDPVIRNMLKRMAESPEKAKEICEEMAMKHPPFASQLEAYIRQELDRQEATLIAEEMIDGKRKKSIRYDRGKRELTIDNTKHIVPKVATAAKKEILLELVCDDYNLRNWGITKGRFNEKVRENNLDLISDRTLETARSQLNKEIEKEFGIKNFLRSRDTKTMIRQ